MTAPSKQLDQFVVRLPDGMRDRIKAAAEANNRSMNAEIVATLLEKYPAPVDPEGEALIEWALRNIPRAELDRFMLDSLRRMGVTDDDIRDGLIPGVVLKTTLEPDG